MNKSLEIVYFLYIALKGIKSLRKSLKDPVRRLLKELQVDISQEDGQQSGTNPDLPRGVAW